MKFGKVEPAQEHLISLPPDHPILSQLPSSSNSLSVFLGGTQWGIKPWVGQWYPPGTNAKGFLAAYAKQFSTIELNATHYRIFDPSQFEEWKSQVPSGFKFLPKLPQSISHYRRLRNTEEQVEAFVEGVRRLDVSLGTCFLQMPENFKSDKFADLEAWLHQWPEDIDLAVEVRHPSWFGDEELLSDLAALLHSQNKGFVLTDAPGRPDVLHMALCSPKLMLRYAGWDDHPLEEVRLNQWADRIDAWAASGLNELYFCIHQPESIQTPETAIQFTERLKKKKGHLEISGTPSKLSLF